MHEDVMTQHITRPKEVRPAASIRALLLASWLGIASLPGSASDLQPNVPQRGYSTATLREPIFDAARVAAEAPAFTNWLNANYASLDAENMAQPREHLYYLIDSHIKNQFASTGQVWPTKHDPILELLFSWAERLGVYGGNVVYDRLRSTDTASSETLNSLPKGVAIDLEGDLLHVRSDLGWSVQFPYYFDPAAPRTATTGRAEAGQRPRPRRRPRAARRRTDTSGEAAVRARLTALVRNPVTVVTCPASTACRGALPERAAGGQLVGVTAAERVADAPRRSSHDDLRCRDAARPRSANATSAVSAECPLPATAIRLPGVAGPLAGSVRSGTR